MTESDPKDQLAVLSLIARIAHLVDAGEVTAYAECFAPDAEWRLPADSGVDLQPQVRRGREEIVAGVQERIDAGIQGPGTATRHVVSTIALESAGPDELRARSYYRYYGDTDGIPQLRTMGQYDDVYRRTAQGWRLCRRTITRG